MLEVGEVNMVDFDNNPLPEGTYQMIVTLEANPTTSAGFVFEWPIVETVTAEPISIEQEEASSEPSRLVSGTWSGVLTEEGTCWILDTPQEGQLLLSRAALGQWAPRQGWSGTYDAVSADAAPACAMFQAPSIEVLTLETETAPFAPDASQDDVEQSGDAAAEASTPTSIAPPLIMVVTTTSLLSLLVTIVLGNESFRIPTTAAGLWFPRHGGAHPRNHRRPLPTWSVDGVLDRQPRMSFPCAYGRA